MRPREVAGYDYRIKAMTTLGEIRRVFRAFDADDAIEQLLNYCYGESLPVDVATLEILGPGGAQRADGDDRLAS